MHAPPVTPRYLRFLITGALVGLAVTLVLVLARGKQLTRPEVAFFYLAIVLGGLGALAGGLLAVVLESRRRR